jgi:hypothetical protein
MSAIKTTTVQLKQTKSDGLGGQVQKKEKAEKGTKIF